MSRFRYVQGMPDPERMRDADEKMAQEAEMMAMRVGGRGPDALAEYEMDAPEDHQEMMARGRKLAGPMDGADMIGGAALGVERRMREPAPPARDGIQQIGDYATQLLERARRQRQAGAMRGGRG